MEEDKEDKQEKPYKQDKQEKLELPGINLWEINETKKAAKDKLTTPKTTNATSEQSAPEDLISKDLSPDAAKDFISKDVQSDTSKDPSRNDLHSGAAKDFISKDVQSDASKDPSRNDLQAGAANDPGRKDLQSGAVLKPDIVGLKLKKEKGLGPFSKKEIIEPPAYVTERSQPGPGKKPHKKGNTKITFLQQKVDQIKTLLSIKKQLMNVLRDVDEIEKLQRKMSNWLSSNEERSFKLFGTVHVNGCLTYQQFFCAMVDLDSPFRFMELYALVIRLSDQKPGLISIEDIMNNIEREEEPAACDICDIEPSKPSRKDNNMIKGLVNMKPGVKSPQIKDAKNLFTEFLFAKQIDEQDESSESVENPTGNISFASSANPLEALTNPKHQDSLGNWNKKTSPTVLPTFGNKLSTNASMHRRVSTKTMMVKRGPKNKNQTRLKNIFAKAAANVVKTARVINVFKMITRDAKKNEETLPSTEDDDAIMNVEKKPLVRYVLVKMRSLVHDDILCCSAHFSRLLDIDSSLSFLAHCMKEVNDIHCTQVYISTNRLQTSQSSLPLNNTLKQCGYQGGCKAHPQQLTLYYDFDIPATPSFIKSRDLLDTIF